MPSTKAACFIGIHKAPPNLTLAEFEVKVGALGDAIAALPVAQRTVLKLDIISQNTLMDKAMTAVGLPVPVPTVVMSVEYKGVDHLDEFLKDPELRKLLAEADDFGFLQGATAFAADEITKVDVPEATAGMNVICIYSRPPHLSAEDFVQKMGDLMDNITAQPIQHHFTNYTLWVQNDAVEKHLQDLGYPVPEPLVIVRAAAENLDGMLEIFGHPEVGQLLVQGIRNFGFHADSENPVDSCCFSADVDTKMNNY
ncbi:hypothetical protein B0H17DRAFT_1067776 [Mycena rosella]|uniref:Uncharacterized protein n=1 Tax=Mycena rosella TaxID=1033263 RepID=A0AAD7DFA7_MYCRO|nr:hypothetical protein B0H17DRAFT_1067776 [Mycena rosella]